MLPSGEFGCTGSSGTPPGSPSGGWNCSLQSNVYTCSSGGGTGYAGCTLTQGYWKNHPSAWPVNQLTLGGVTYSEDELITILQTPPSGGDASLILAHQLIAALLNVQKGAGVPPAVQSAIDAAQAWLASHKDADGRLPYGVHDDAATSLADTLDRFNNGLAGPPHCG
jgi:hypothetical protein